MASLYKFANKRKTGKDIVPYRRINSGYVGGSFVTPETSKKVAAFYRGLVYISTQIAKLPLEVKTSSNQIIENKIWALLNIAPNREMTAFTLKTDMIQEAILEGNSYAEIERNRLGEPVAIHKLEHNKVERWRAKSGEIVYRVISGTFDGKDVYLPYDDVLQIKNLVTKDGQIGQGVVGYAQDTLGISLGANKYASSLYDNAGMPSGVLEADRSLSDDAFERIKISWKENHGGRKAGGVAVLEDGVTFKPVSFSPDVLQFLESRKFSVLEIARYLGLPPTKLFDGDSATYNNIEHSNLEVATDTLDTWARNLESEFDVKLTKREFTKTRTEFDMYAVFRGDMNTRANYFQKMMQNASITPNEIREKEGYAPYPEGDRFYVAVNNFSPADKIDDLIDSQINKGQTNKESDEEEKSTELQAVAIDFLKRRTRN